MPATDYLLTKSITVGAAGTFVPVGPNYIGGANVDEWEIMRGLLGSELFFLLHWAQAAGTSPTLAPTLVTDDNVAFSSAQLRLTGVTIAPPANAAGWSTPFSLGYVHEPYAQVSLVAGGTTPNFGLVRCFLIPAQILRDFQFKSV